jgi:RNA polymerase sigma-70 factor, ECF subfamily
VRAEDAEAAVLNDEADAERELATYMATFVAALPSPYREALVLTELQEMSHKDAAQMLGVSLPAMKARVRRGRQQIQQMLEACCDIALDARGRVLSYERHPDGTVPKNCCADDKGCKC